MTDLEGFTPIEIDNSPECLAEWTAETLAADTDDDTASHPAIAPPDPFLSTLQSPTTTLSHLSTTYTIHATLLPPTIPSLTIPSTFTATATSLLLEHLYRSTYTAPTLSHHIEALGIAEWAGCDEMQLYAQNEIAKCLEEYGDDMGGEVLRALRAGGGVGCEEWVMEHVDTVKKRFGAGLQETMMERPEFAWKVLDGVLARKYLADKDKRKRKAARVVKE